MDDDRVKERGHHPLMDIRSDGVGGVTPSSSPISILLIHLAIYLPLCKATFILLCAIELKNQKCDFNVHIRTIIILI